MAAAAGTSGAITPRQLAAIFSPPTLLLEYATADGALSHHELVLASAALTAVRRCPHFLWRHLLTVSHTHTPYPHTAGR